MGEEKKVREQLEVIEDGTIPRGVMLDKDGTHSERKRRIVPVVRGVQIVQIAQQADDSSTEEYDEFCKSLTNDLVWEPP